MRNYGYDVDCLGRISRHSLVINTSDKGLWASSGRLLGLFLYQSGRLKRLERMMWCINLDK